MMDAINEFFDIKNMTGWKMIVLTFGPFIALFIAMKVSDKQFAKKIKELEQQKS